MAESVGRPKSIIDWKYVDTLLIAGCSGREISFNIGLNPKTLYERCETEHGVPFSEYSQQKYAKGDSLLRKQQFDKALGRTTDGDNMMLIWLGKNRLKQSDAPQEINVSTETVQAFKALMNQFDNVQDARKIAPNSDKSV